MKTEKLIFKILGSSSANKRLRLMNNQQRKIITELDSVVKDRYEQQLLKYFDFAGWIRSLLEGKTRKTEAKMIS